MPNYQETLDKIEKFMNDSGIRDFCSEQCHGKCCSGCYEKNPDACHRNEGRRLACSAFICSSLRVLIFSPNEAELWDHICMNINHQHAEADLKHAHKSLYHTPYPAEAKKNYRVKKTVLAKLKNFNVQAIREKLTKLDIHPDCPFSITIKKRRGRKTTH
ncbi:MAG: hypothetical protein NT116_02255 [Candidatus Parcubacteria bacterium]|nr:hypothetical protein [Candidatus Parcubacteria bacterium]